MTESRFRFGKGEQSDKLVRTDAFKRPTEFKVHAVERKHTGYFQIDRLEVAFEQFGKRPGAAQAFSEKRPVEVAQRGNAVAAILYDPVRREVVLVDQFRLPTTSLFSGPMVSEAELKSAIGPNVDKGGWLLETVAGAVRKSDEKPEALLRERVSKETGYRVTELTRICKFFPSPGGSNETIELYYGEITDEQRETHGGGSSGEDIDVVAISIDDFFDRLSRFEFQDAKVIIGGYWLRDYLARRPIEPETKTKTYPYRRLPSRATGTDSRLIGIKTGSIVDVKNVDAWINPENTNMQMDRYFGRTISSAIRWGGAEKRKVDSTEVVKRDLVADELRAKLGNRLHVGIGDIIDTTPGALAKAANVKRIFHVAVAEGHFEQGLRTDVPKIRTCLKKALDEIEKQNNRSIAGTKYSSVLVPMLGAGTGGVPVRDLAPALVECAISFFDSNPRSRIGAIYFNAYTASDLFYLRTALDDYCKTDTGFKTDTGTSETAGAEITADKNAGEPRLERLPVSE